MIVKGKYLFLKWSLVLTFLLFLSTAVRASELVQVLPPSSEGSVKKISVCKVGGCSGQLCVDASLPDLATTCEWMPEYACYRLSICEAQDDGRCGWSRTDEFDKCIGGTGGTPAVKPIVTKSIPPPVYEENKNSTDYPIIKISPIPAVVEEDEPAGFVFPTETYCSGSCSENEVLSEFDGSDSDLTETTTDNIETNNLYEKQQEVGNIQESVNGFVLSEPEYDPGDENSMSQAEKDEELVSRKFERWDFIQLLLGSFRRGVFGMFKILMYF